MSEVANMEKLKAMGYSEQDAKEALDRTSSVEAAIDWLTKEKKVSKAVSIELAQKDTEDEIDTLAGAASAAGVKWVCPVCTFENVATASVCNMCNTPRNAGAADGKT